MSPRLALLLCSGFVLWLLVRDKRRQANESVAVWVPFLWLGILASRPISLWFGIGMDISSPDAYLEGSPVDRAFFSSLIIVALVVLVRRGWGGQTVISSNKWLAAFLIYWGLSCLWSDYTYIAYKRWIKDLGNVVMVLLLLSEPDPEQAIVTAFRRCAYVLLPFSVLLIKYFPGLGRTYNRWTGEVMCQGVSGTGKNGLGALVLVGGIFLVWDFLQQHRLKRLRKADKLVILVFLVMAVWLFHVANSATSLVCFGLGSVLLMASGTQFARRHVEHAGSYIVAAGLFVFTVQTLFNVDALVFEALGRNTSLTGRTDIWRAVLSMQINPVVGVGYYSFWMGPRTDEFVQKYGGEGLNQAHNGYLETYLEGGVIGVFLLLAFLMSSVRAARRRFVAGKQHARIQLTILIVGVIYNFTEGVFDRLSPVWFALLAMAIVSPFSISEEPNRSTAAVRALVAGSEGTQKTADVGPSALTERS